MADKYVVSVADAYLFDKCNSGYIEPFVPGDLTAALATQNVLFNAKTLTDSSIETTISSSDSRGGFGNQLLNVYYHSAEMTVNFTDARFNMVAVKALVGDDTFTEGGTGAGENVITVKAGYVPEVLEAVLVAKLAGENTDGCTGIIGNLVIHIPMVALDGNMSISMAADGTATTPFKGRALAFTPNGENESIYAKLYEFGNPTIKDFYREVTLDADTYVDSAYYTFADAGVGAPTSQGELEAGDFYELDGTDYIPSTVYSALTTYYTKTLDTTYDVGETYYGHFGMDFPARG